MENKVILITGARKGIGQYLAHYYLQKGHNVIGCSRGSAEYEFDKYRHFCLDISDEAKVRQMLDDIKKTYGRLDVLINNAGIASMNHSLLTPLKAVHKLLNTNFVGTFLLCRESARLMQINKYGRIVNFTTVAVPLMLEGEAVYAASKSAVITLTQIMARELAPLGITVNALGPTPIKTDLIHAVPEEKINNIINQQAIHRFGHFNDISHVIDFFIHPQSDFITGQVIYLGGVS
jgi:3-oxoacyl-[acyl-carrier protein] reductase